MAMTPQKPTKRKPGRPKRSEAVCTPEVVEQIRAMYVRGAGARKIAQVIGTAHHTVQHHIDHTVKPLIRQQAMFDTGLNLARAEMVIALAFEGYDRSLRAATKRREKFASIEEIKRKIKGKAPKARYKGKDQFIERTVETIERDGDRGWLEIVLAAMDFMAKVKGGYAPSRVHAEISSELRIAGMTPLQLDQAMIARAAELVVQRQRHQQIIDEAARAAGLDN